MVCEEKRSLEYSPVCGVLIPGVWRYGLELLIRMSGAIYCSQSSPVMRAEDEKKRGTDRSTRCT